MLRRWADSGGQEAASQLTVWQLRGMCHLSRLKLRRALHGPRLASKLSKLYELRKFTLRYFCFRAVSFTRRMGLGGRGDCAIARWGVFPLRGTSPASRCVSRWHSGVVSKGFGADCELCVSARADARLTARRALRLYR